MKQSKLLSTTLIGGMLFLGGSALQAETLKEAVDTMLQTHPEIRSIAHNRLGRDQEVRQAKMGYYPKVDFIAGWGIREIQEPDVADDSLDPAQYTLSLRQNLFTGLATKNEVDRQKARVKSEAYTLQGSSENTALRTTEVFLNVLRQEELKRLSDENLETHLRISDQIKMRSDSGVASKADSDQASGRVALAEANVIATKTNVLDAYTNYQAVVGHLPVDLEVPVAPDSLMPASVEEAESAAIKQHPTLKSAEADLEARNKQYEVAKAPFMPIVDIEVDKYWEEEVDTIYKDEELVAMLKVRYNLFQGFKDQARRAETAELISEAREIRNNTHRQVIESIRLSWMAYQAVLDRIKYLEDRVTATVDTAQSYNQQFNLGKRTLLDVLDTEAEVIDAKKALVEAKYDGLFAQYRILNGLGLLVKSFDLTYPKEAEVDGDDQEAADSKKDDSSKDTVSEVILHPLQVNKGNS